jgi:DNA-binding NtrC family response regulator
MFELNPNIMGYLNGSSPLSGLFVIRLARHSLPRIERRLPTEQTLSLQDTQKTILVVEDDPALLKVVTSILVRDYNVLRASSGREALQVSRSYQPATHLLLSDFEMPEMNGIALATQISLERPQIKVLLMSGFTDEKLVLNEGWHFLPKPFSASQLHTLIAGLINPEDSDRAKRAVSEMLLEDVQ